MNRYEPTRQQGESAERPSWRDYQVRVELIRELPPPYAEPIKVPDDVYELFRDEVARWDREHFLTVLLDGAHRVVGVEEVHVGTLNHVPTHPREVMKAALLANACSIIIVHNHPSGDLTPSKADHAVTRILRRAGEILGIECLDHIIIGRAGFFSFREQGLWTALPKEPA